MSLSQWFRFILTIVMLAFGIVSLLLPPVPGFLLILLAIKLFQSQMEHVPDTHIAKKAYWKTGTLISLTTIALAQTSRYIHV